MPRDRDDVKTSTWLSGFVISSIMCTIIVTLWFDMSWWESIIAILFGIPLSVICIQCTGETDTTPTGAVGKVWLSFFDSKSCVGDAVASFMTMQCVCL